MAIGITVGVLITVLLGLGALQLQNFRNDPSNLAEFPAERYLENYQAVAGGRYHADLRVENELRFREGAGKLMILGTKNSQYSFPVLIAPELAEANFTKGQLYRFEIIIREGGLIYGTRAIKL